MTTETEVQEARDAAQALTNAGLDAAGAWDRYYELNTEVHPEQALTPWERELLAASRGEYQDAGAPQQPARPRIDSPAAAGKVEG
jgi:hypothetical protein